MAKVDISPLLYFTHNLCYINGYNRDMAMKLYQNVTCLFLGSNKKEIQIAEVSKLVQG